MPQVDEDARLPVTRHGFEQNGVDCPNCKRKAADPGDWKMVHTIHRKKGEDIWSEEAVICQHCHKMLMASPDTDIDPIKEGEPYDMEYHLFARPAKWVPPMQEYEEGAPNVGDWVVFMRGSVAVVNGALRSMSCSEGRLISIEDGTAEVQINTDMFGRGNTEVAKVPVSDIHKMKFVTFKVGTEVFIFKGKHAGKKGIVEMINPDDMRVKTEDGSIVRINIESLKVA